MSGLVFWRIPISAGITRRVSVGFIRESIDFISLIKDSSRASLPAVSMKTTLYFSISFWKDL